jgi:peptidyl-tRNA hydrolase ICT1
MYSRVNSKAQLRVPIDKLLPSIPTLLHSAVLASRYYTDKSRSLLIQADDSRKQSANRDACYDKLQELLVELATLKIPGETSQSQKEKVKNLQQTEREARLRSKRQHSNKKASRSKSRDD